MTTLITGGSGRTSGALAKLLHDANRPFIVASRSGEAAPYKGVKFDYLDETTYENPFKVDANIDRAYVLAPPGRVDVMAQVTKFIDFAISKGVKRIVFLSATLVSPDDPVAGVLHKHIIDTGVDYAVLRPTWFIQNFGLNFVATIRDHDFIFSATEDARLPFISTEDIGQAAFDALTAEQSPNKDIFVLGPELLSYADAAKVISSVLGREIIHKRYTVEELGDAYAKFGLDPIFAKILASMEGAVAKGTEENAFNSKDINKFIGKHTLAEFIQENKALYIK